VADHDGEPVLSITQLYQGVEQALRGAFPTEVWVAGEVRSFNVSSRGHCYLDLVDPAAAKDAGAPVLKVICWSGRWARLRAKLDGLGITLDAGLVVRVRGELQLYRARGDISLILSEMDTDALLGNVAAERARVVKALIDDGVFDRNRSVPVPVPPLRIGLVASPGTEGYRDFVGSLAASGMAFHVTVVPTQVQGREAPASVAQAIAVLGRSGCDVIAVVRGGGSKADLATFDSEPVARAIATCPVAVWTGIGHTGDLSVADEVANRAAITPTECAQELARRVYASWSAAVDAGMRIAGMATSVVDRAEVHLAQHRARVGTGARAQLDRQSDRLAHRAVTLRSEALRRIDGHSSALGTRATALAAGARRTIEEAERAVAGTSLQLAASSRRRLVTEEHRLRQWHRLLAAYDYRRQLERGYTVTRDAGGRVVASVAGVVPGAELIIQMADGSVHARAESVSDPEPRAGGRGQPEHEGAQP